MSSRWWEIAHRAKQDTTFKFTPRTTRTVLTLGVAVPFGIYYLAKDNQKTWDWQAKRRDQSLYTEPEKGVFVLYKMLSCA